MQEVQHDNVCLCSLNNNVKINNIDAYNEH